MKFKDVAISNASTEAKVAALAVLLDKELLKLAETVLNVQKIQGPQGEQGLQGLKGEQGDRGFDGTNGKDGSNGKDGKDGAEGKQGVGVQDAKIDFDGSLVITLTDGTEINAGEIVPLDTAEKIRVIGNGGGTSQSVLDAIEAVQATIATYGTMATQDANNVAITGGSINGTTVGSTTPAAGTFTTLTATGQTSLGGAAGSEGLRVVTTASAINWVEAAGTSTAFGTVAVSANGASSAVNLGLRSRGSGSLILGTNSGAQTQAVVSHTASAVNYVQVTGAATTGAPVISAQGSDASVQLRFSAKGTQSIRFDNNNTANQIFRIDGSATNSVNYLQASGANTTLFPVLSAQGSDTNISQVFQSKGTGAIDLAAGSRGVNISNGGTVTAITGTAAGNAYTSFPTVALSAPTTAGGVQATVSVTRLFQNIATIAGGGTGYTVGDTLTVVGGTPVGSAATLTVSSVSSGVITAVASANFAQYTALPTNPVSVTGGTGSGATLNLQWSVLTGTGSYTITNAGSGYVEQPTVSFSGGGGGSGAAAYATVGSIPTLKTIGSALSFAVPSGEVFRVADSSPSSINFVQVEGSGGGSIFRTSGASTNTSLGFVNKGTGSFYFSTNNSAGNTQFNVAHTASAVNYVQVTGAATGSAPSVIAAGSDTNVGFSVSSKGTGTMSFFTNSVNTNSRHLDILHTGSVVNRFQITGSVAGSPVVLGVNGSDTNIDLTLTPKGTGNVRFGTYTASMALTVQGYIEIKDSGGTVRKLAVIA